MYQKWYIECDIIRVQRSENDMKEKKIPKIRFMTRKHRKNLPRTLTRTKPKPKMKTKILK